jgi:hypothetical protein
MTGNEFKAIRFKLGLSGLESGRMLGYAGKPHNVRVQVRQWEQEVRPIPPWRLYGSSWFTRGRKAHVG